MATIEAGATPDRHFFIARQDGENVLMRQVSIPGEALGSEVVARIKYLVPIPRVFLANLFNQRVDIGQIDRAPDFPGATGEVQIFPTARIADDRLSHALNEPSVRTDIDVELGGGAGLPFADAYPALFSTSEPRKVLIVGSRLRGVAKLSFVAIAVLAFIGTGLGMGFATEDINTGAAIMSAGIAVVGVFARLFWDSA